MIKMCYWNRIVNKVFFYYNNFTFGHYTRIYNKKMFMSHIDFIFILPITSYLYFPKCSCFITSNNNVN